jgi:hypothetical protein
VISTTPAVPRMNEWLSLMRVISEEGMVSSWFLARGEVK